MSYTKGPWSATPTNNNQLLIKSKDALICTITRNAVQKERAENAYLIAASPEMLDVLKQILSNCSDDNGEEFSWEVFNNTLAVARKVIDKAEGHHG